VRKRDRASDEGRGGELHVRRDKNGSAREGASLQEREHEAALDGLSQIEIIDEHQPAAARSGDGAQRGEERAALVAM
jgi:hypothetical protein